MIGVIEKREGWDYEDYYIEGFQNTLTSIMSIGEIKVLYPVPELFRKMFKLNLRDEDALTLECIYDYLLEKKAITVSYIKDFKGMER